MNALGVKKNQKIQRSIGLKMSNIGFHIGIRRSPIASSVVDMHPHKGLDDIHKHSGDQTWLPLGIKKELKQRVNTLERKR